MKSLGQFREALPKGFTEWLYRDFPPSKAEHILRGMATERPTTLRVNTLRATPQAVEEEFQREGIRLKRISWLSEAFEVDGAREGRIERTRAYTEGAVYLQSLSSMLPPLCLLPQPGEQVLDMAAAPGSKTTQMAAMMRNEGRIVAVEPAPRRAATLQANLIRQGATIVEVVAGRGEQVASRHPASFDRVLLDAPCSGEGRFTPSPQTYRHWNEREVQRLAKLQKGMLGAALGAVKPGGLVLYSTCTLNRQENEEVVIDALGRGGAELVALPMDVPESLPGRAGCDGPRELARTRRVLPVGRMEGFYLALLRRLDAAPAS